MSSAVFVRRVFSVLAAAVLVAATFAPVDADARAGRSGSFGSRGSKTFDAAPPTATSPGGQQIQRSTQPGLGNPSASAAAPRPAARTGGMFGGGLMGGIMGGLLGAGLFGLLSGSGFLGGLGSLASMLGLVIQIVLVVIVVRLAMNWFRNRNQSQSARTGYPAPAGAAPAPAPTGASFGGAQPTSVNSDRFQYGSGSSVPPAGNSYGGGSYGAAGAQRPEYGEVTIEASDYEAFEKMLVGVQEAWSRQDLGTLHRIATPEMSQMFADDLAELSRDGVVNRVSNVKLLQGDLSESWSENNEDYATVAMRYELVDVTEDMRTRQVVDGDPTRPTEATELWTFVRPSQGGEWRLSAVQQSEEQKKGLFGGLFG